MSARRVSAAAIRARKGSRFPVVTAYDAAFARIAEAAGIDVLLCGDSLGMVVLGYSGTTAVTLEDMIRHGGAVARGSNRAHVMVDVPFGAFEADDATAIGSAVGLVRAGASSVKIEGGRRNAQRVRAIVDAGIPVCGHVGVLPQTAELERGYRRRNDRDALLDDVDAFVEAGAFALVLEMVDFDIAGEITRRADVPTIGIGSGRHCDAQVLVLHDVLGLYDDSPPFAKRFAEIGAATSEGLRAYASAVSDGTFPDDVPAPSRVPAAHGATPRR